MGRLDGKVAVITGGARGQGEAEVRLFVEEGARVVVADILEDRGRVLADELGDVVVFNPADVGEPDDWDRTVKLATTQFGRLDILVNNAGANLSALLEDTAVEDYLKLFRINQLGPWLGIRAVTPVMRGGGGGSIVNTGSASTFAGVFKKTAYTSTKHALRGLTQCAASELGRYGIRVNAVHPGGIASEMTSGFPDKPGGADEFFARQPIPRIGRPEEVARAVLFFASDDSSYCTGTEMVIDGGMLSSLIGEGPPVRSEALDR